MKKNKPNCYECRWRGEVPGDAHSKCCHPYNAPLLNNSMLSLIGMLAGGRKEALPIMFDKRLKIEANEHGIRSGWFNYPFNFDPVWLDNCMGFTRATKDDPRITNKCEKPTFCDSCDDRFKCFTERKGATNGLDSE